MEQSTCPQRPSRSFTEYLIFAALLIPTFLVLGAAVVSLAAPEPAVVVEQPVLTAAVCEPCPRHAEDYLP